MTTTSHPMTETSEPRTPTWNPPCVVCGNPIGVEMPDGKYVGRTKCDSCSGEAKLQQLKNAGIPQWAIEQKVTLPQFETRGTACLERVAEKARTFMATLTGGGMLFDRCWLLLTGTEGTGKSHLAAAIAMGAISAGHTARFATFDEVLVEIIDAYSAAGETNADRAESVLDVVKKYTDVELLVLDDVGVEQPTPHSIQILYRILNKRLNDRRPTVMTSNYPLTNKRKGQPTLGERLSEKLTDDTPVRRILDRIAGEARYEHLDVPSYRRMKKS